MSDLLNFMGEIAKRLSSPPSDALIVSCNVLVN